MAVKSLADELKRTYHQTSWALILRGVLALLVGILVLARPLESVGALALVIAMWSVLSGSIEIVQAFELKSVLDKWWIMLWSGIIAICFGTAALIYYPDLSLGFVVVLVSWWFLFSGGLAIVAAVQQRKLGLQWGWTALFGVIGVLAGGYAIVYPPAALAAIMALIAVAALCSGAAMIIGAFRLRALVRPILKYAV